MIIGANLMGDISKALSKAIKEAKWLSIDYQNREGDKTSYWCAIKDIDIDSKKLIVTAFNVSKIDNPTQGILFDAFLFYESIIHAEILEHTSYERPIELITKIESNIDKLIWLNYDLYNDKILDYLKECVKYDSIPYQKETALISAVDHEELLKSKNRGYYELSLKQIAELVEQIERLSKQDKVRFLKINELAMNMLSISTKQGLFVAAYKKLLFNPEERALVLSDIIYYNYEFSSDENDTFKHNLRNYLDIETDDFTELFEINPEKAKEMLAPFVKKFNESIDDRPYIMDLVRSYNGFIDKEFHSISQAKVDQKLSTPLKAFFGNMDTSLVGKKRKFDIVLLDNMMNIDQLRVIHNALKQPITYVQGPPGTGKTQSILNLLISAFFNEQTVLVSSNNNKPIDDIYNKIKKIESRNIPLPFPILRLGNNQKVKESIQTIKDYLSKYDKFDSDDEKLSKLEISNKNHMKDINNIIDNYERRLELEEEIDALISMLTNINLELKSNIIIQLEFEKKQKELSSIPILGDEEIHNHVVKADDGFLTWLFFTSIKHIKKLKEPKYKQFIEILNHDDEEERIRLFNTYIIDNNNFIQLQRVFPIIMTTNQSAYRLGSPTTNFDIVIIDEAGQCSIGAALFPIIRGKRLLLVGDQNQLRPVITLSPETNKKLMEKFAVSKSYNYVQSSIIRLMQNVDSVSKFILLRYHYRCHKDIIEFSNKKYYNKQLIIPSKSGFDKQALFFIDVEQKEILRSNEKNTSLLEIEAIINDIKNRKNASIGIITPFRNQADLIRDRINEENLRHVDVGTVHTFQGDEKDTIYMSSAITVKSSLKTFDWIKNNQELINVATTRAKKEFIMVGDFNEIKKRSKETNDFYELANYVKKNGKEVFLINDRNNNYSNSSNFRQYNTTKEKELLETVNHVLSFGSKYVVGKQVKVADILNKYTQPVLFDYGSRAVFDFVIYAKLKRDDIPRLVIELDGDEHLSDSKTIERDRLKEKICEDNKIKLIRIPNNYSRRYSFVKELIIKVLNEH
jgi:hypothetical protein